MPIAMEQDIRSILERALLFRSSFLSAAGNSMFRLFNGYTENFPGLVIDIFAKTAVIQYHGDDDNLPAAVADFLIGNVPFLKAVMLKKRNSLSRDERNGILIYGSKMDDVITEHGIRYAVDLTLNMDCSFYGDTRNLRQYLLENSRNKKVLNTFAYTASLGVAASCGGAAKVINSDLSSRFMAVGCRSLSLNQQYYTKKNFLCGNFFQTVAKLKHKNELFDTVILDPPFFSSTAAGKVDMAENMTSLINKVRPLIADGGTLCLVNNSLYLSGREFLNQLQTICDGHYLTLGETIAVPPDFTGPAPEYPVSQEPFNHPTKIVLLSVRRKDKAVQ